MNAKSQEVATTVEHLPAQAEAQSDGTVLINIIQDMCSKPDFDPAKMQQIINMRKEMFLEQARIVFNESMARVQGLIQPVIADEDNLQTGSRYAKLNAIIKALSPIYTAEGFTVSYDTEACPIEHLAASGWFRITSELNHAGGYTKNYHVDLPLDTTGPKGQINKTAIHGAKSAISYARVILMGLMFNFTTSLDVDDDGNAAGAPLLTEEQVATLRDHTEALKGNEQKFAESLGADCLENVHASRWPQAMATIKRHQKKQKESAK